MNLRPPSNLEETTAAEPALERAGLAAVVDTTRAEPSAGDGSGNFAEISRVAADPVLLTHQRQSLLAKMFGARGGPTRLGRYELIEELGRGGMGVVYKARDPKLSRYVAIKLITKDDLKMRDRFRREAQALAKVKHANVIDVYDTDFDESGRPYITMDYVDGQTLKEWLQASRDVQEIFEVFAAAGRGLAVVHAHGIVHHDFKPENVLIGKDGRVLVADFGLAKASTSEDTLPEDPRGHDALTVNITQTGAVLGTLAYMAPELLMHDDARGDVRSDQFSFCASLYEALAGERLFDVQGKDFPHVREEILRCHVKPLPRAKRIPRGVEAAIRKGLSVRPGDRHPSMTQLMDLLERGSVRPERGRSLTRVTIGLAFALAPALVAIYVLTKVNTRASSGFGDAEREDRHPIEVGVRTEPPKPAEQLAPTKPALKPGTEARVTPAPPPTPATGERPKPGSAKIPVTLSDGDLLRAKHDAEAAALRCAAEYRSLRSSLEITFSVTPKGKVDSAHVDVAGLGVGLCVEDHVKGQRFPRSQTGVSKTWTLPLK